MKQTAVEWFTNQLEKHYVFQDIKNTTAFLHAKEMEKEQVRTILLAYNEERNDRTDGAQNQWEPYEVDEFLENYNETFKTNEK